MNMKAKEIKRRKNTTVNPATKDTNLANVFVTRAKVGDSSRYAMSLNHVRKALMPDIES